MLICVTFRHEYSTGGFRYLADMWLFCITGLNKYMRCFLRYQPDHLTRVNFKAWGKMWGKEGPK